MVVSDPIADFLTRIRNANQVFHERVEVPGSKMKRAIAEILKREGYIRDYEWIDDGKQGILRVYLRYGPGKTRVIQGLRRISRPGLRIYAKRDQIPRVLGGLGIAILSTSRGIMTDKEARRQGVGGEVLCYVW
ncbi:30S ribosomal protein S8 [Caldinitratiruptor microaerophilus]|uniref:Small ribosomal subunit protein uS8 n=1 Tax=Caldinitratiruptor microaerophilus TaxID=671077 RepID=A0AA35CMV2_9FIRM|nr:30S ribosomal protein S8 [Caldinitratiruptor microaerophilus]BDG62234.1 30S ribosomal protein S8 [Caldinitratiruptor microaerophilus]